MLRSLVAVTLYTVVAAGLCNVARAEQPPAATAGQDAEAKGLFQAGAAAYAEGRYEDAL